MKKKWKGVRKRQSSGGQHQRTCWPCQNFTSTMPALNGGKQLFEEKLFEGNIVIILLMVLLQQSSQSRL